MTELKKQHDILHSEDKSGNTLLTGRNEVLKDFRESGKIFPEINDKNIHTITLHYKC